MELLAEIEIPLYIRQYVKSESVRPKYYEKGKRELPSKYCNKSLINTQNIKEPDGIKYIWKSFPVIRQGKKKLIDYLTEAASGKRIVANEAQVGTTNVVNINGQAIYNGNIYPQVRNSMIGQIKDQYRKFIKDLPPITRFPIRITVYVFDTIIDDTFSNGQEWDLDNRFFPYGKAFSDALTKEGKIPNDTIYYISEPPHAIFVPVNDVQDRKLLIRIHKDSRPVILNNYLYQRFHGDKLK